MQVTCIEADRTDSTRPGAVTFALHLPRVPPLGTFPHNATGDIASRAAIVLEFLDARKVVGRLAGPRWL